MVTDILSGGPDDELQGALAILRGAGFSSEIGLIRMIAGLLPRRLGPSYPDLGRDNTLQRRGICGGIVQREADGYVWTRFGNRKEIGWWSRRNSVRGLLPRYRLSAVDVDLDVRLVDDRYAVTLNLCLLLGLLSRSGLGL